MQAPPSPPSHPHKDLRWIEILGPCEFPGRIPESPIGACCAPRARSGGLGGGGGGWVCCRSLGRGRERAAPGLAGPKRAPGRRPPHDAQLPAGVPGGSEHEWLSSEPHRKRRVLVLDAQRKSLICLGRAYLMKVYILYIYIYYAGRMDKIGDIA